MAVKAAGMLTYDHCGCQVHMGIDDTTGEPVYMTPQDMRHSHDAMIDEQIDKIRTSHPNLGISGNNRYEICQNLINSLVSKMDRLFRETDLKLATGVITDEIHDAQIKNIKRLTGDLISVNPSPQPTAYMCPNHKNLGHTIARFNQVQEENQRKNKTLADAAEVAGVDFSPTLDKVKTLSAKKTFNSDAEKIGWEKMVFEGMKAQAAQFIADYKYSFDTNRTLIVKHSSLTGEHKLALQDRSDRQYGVNKVKVN